MRQAQSDAQPRGRLLRRTFVLAFLLVASGLAVSAAVELYFSYRENVANIAALQTETSRAAAFKIRQFVSDIEKAMAATAQSADAVANGFTPTFRFQLLKLLKIAPAVTNVVAADRNGHEIARVSRVDLVNPQDSLNHAADGAFATANQGAHFHGPVYFVRDSEPYMRIAVPIEWFVGQIEGVLIAEVSLKYIRDVVVDISVGRNGYAYVVSNKGDLIAHPDLSLVLQKRNLADLGQIKAALAGVTIQPAIQKNLVGERIFAAFAPVPDLDWAVLVEQPIAEAYAPLLRSVFRTFLLLLAGMAPALLASHLITRKVLRPLEILRHGATRLGAGALNQRIAVKTGDELEIVANAFNDMATRLESVYAGLERTVEDRTRELQQANTKLEAASAKLAEWNQTLEQRVDAQVVEIERIGRLKRFIAPQLANLIVSTGDDQFLESHRREITVVFADLRGFTKFSDSVEPERLMAVLKEYHHAIGALIFEYEATLERFAGDGVMVYFNDPLPCPDPPARAVRLSNAMRTRVHDLTERWRAQGDDLGFGVGVAAGYATLGQIGFEGRVDYAAIGPVTNLASRLCDEAKAGQILISQRVQVAVSDIAETEPIGALSLKGFRQPVPAFNVIALRCLEDGAKRGIE